MYQSLALLAGFLLVYSLIAARVERTWISGAMIFTAFGVLIGPLALDVFTIPIEAETLKTLAELTLALVLFTDAAGADLNLLRRFSILPIRLLLIGLPLTIGLGYVAGMLIFPEWGWVPTMLLATMLAPTDAALGKPVVSNKEVPVSIREALTVESGLNDGICVPFLLLFLALLDESSSTMHGVSFALRLFAEEIGIGVGIGLSVAVLGATLIRLRAASEWPHSAWDQIPVIALAFVCFGLAQWCGGSGFIAAFVGGLCFGGFVSAHRERVLRAAEGTGNVFTVITWIIFGAAVIGQSGGFPDLRALLYAALSLTVVRMLPVLASLLGYHATWGKKLFMGWFGPRGLATVVFAVIVLDAPVAEGDAIVRVVVYTVVLSVLLHGVTANPWADALAKREQTSATG